MRVSDTGKQGRCRVNSDESNLTCPAGTPGRVRMCLVGRCLERKGFIEERGSGSRDFTSRNHRVCLQFRLG